MSATTALYFDFVPRSGHAWKKAPQTSNRRALPRVGDSFL
jgi:hypothetical protein